MKLLKFAAVPIVLTLAAATASAEVQVTIHDGLVTIVAKDATVRQIIAEWARVGQAQVVNAERIPGGPTNIELTNVPEAQVLDTLLRSAAGYLAAPRAVMASNLSRFDRVVVMPTSNPPRTPVPAPQPAFQQPPQFAQPVDDDVDDDRAAAPNVVMPTPNPRGPVFNTFPQPQVVNPQTGAPVTGVPVQMPPYQQPPQDPQQMPPTTYPSMPTAPFGGVAVPGMVVPAPQQGQPGQIVPPGQVPPQPGQPRRPGQPDGENW
jgi:hypothetical protein